MIWTGLRSADLKPRYLSKGRGAELYGGLDYLQGWRGRLEGAVLRAQRATLRSVPLDQEQAQAVEVLERHVAITDALLLWTGYYKHTWSVGPVVRGAGASAFCKHFKDQTAAQQEALHIARLSPVLPPGIRILPVDLVGGAVALYPLVNRIRRSTSPTALRCHAYQLGRRALEADVVPGLEPPPGLDSSLPLLLEVVGPAVVERVREVVEQAKGAPAPVGHGDFTPWNIVASGEDDIVLLDYEAVGNWPEFYDLVHLGLQTAAAQRQDGRRALADATRLLRSNGVNHAGRLVELAGVWSLLETLRQYQHNPGNRRRTVPALVMKSAAVLAQSARR